MNYLKNSSQMDRWMEVQTVLKIVYSNQKRIFNRDNNQLINCPLKLTGLKLYVYPSMVARWNCG